jgi:hypothetical protein
MAQAAPHLRHPVGYGYDVDRAYEADYRANIAERVVWLVAGVILAILAFRFVFTFLGANPANSFAHFIYSVSQPLVAPFFGLFNYNYVYGVSKFETYTLVAIAVYALAAAGIARLVTLGRHYE